LAGNWEDIGFRDGERGGSRSRLVKIAETCGEVGVSPDRTAYVRGLEMGLKRYCGWSNGFSHGRHGNSPNAECEIGGFSTYLDAYAEGLIIHEIEEERDHLVDRWRDRSQHLMNVSQRLDSQGLDDKERRRLERKYDRLNRQMENLRIEIRTLERLHDLPRWTPSSD
ncbi:MAG: DUF2799 domain-containing protein, partial [Pseudomonadota bacterium]